MKRNELGQMIATGDSHMDRVEQCVADGIKREDMPERTGLTEKQITAALCNLINRKRIEVARHVGRGKGHGRKPSIYRMPTEKEERPIRASSVFSRANSIFNVAA